MNNKIALVTVIKDEQEYLKEWLDYHIPMVDKIFIFEDINSSSHRDIVCNYCDKVELIDSEHLYFNKKDKLLKLINYNAYNQNKKQIEMIQYVINLHTYDWCIVMDIDEFLTITDNRSLHEVLYDYSEYDELLIYWRNYGANGHIYKPDYNNGLYRKFYTKECNQIHKDIQNKAFTKKALNLNRINFKLGFFTQHFHNSENYIKTDFTKDVENQCYDKLYIKHYITKSFEEYYNKLFIRGMCNNGHRTLDDFFEMNPDMEDKRDEIYAFTEKLNNKNSVIISLTSFKPRLKYAHLVINSLLNQTYKQCKICLTLFKGDLEYITPELQALIDINKVELIVCDEDLGPHKKYYYVMQKYKENPIITVDDDVIYDNNLVETLIASYRKYPNCVSGRRVHKIRYDENGYPLEYMKWWFEYRIEYSNPSFDLFATGIGGILYPPNILQIDSISLDDIRKYLYVDDIYLKWRENSLGVKVVWAKNYHLIGGKQINNPEILDSALGNVNLKGGRNNKSIKEIGLIKQQD